jgi:hypothetical protein
LAISQSGVSEILLQYPKVVIPEKAGMQIFKAFLDFGSSPE